MHFLPGKHRFIFKAIADIYKATMEVHEIEGPIPIILAKDKTKVKQQIAWEPKFDTLAGFCSHREDHVCISDYEPLVGVGDDG
jgi:hypothetical protein